MISSNWESEICEKKIFDSPNLGPTDQNQAQNEVFRHFLSLDPNLSLKLHTMIAWDNL